MEGLLDAERMRSVDAWAIDDRGVPSLELMDAAGGALAQAVRERAGEGPVRVVCGKGNNGGDGLVAARLLRETGFEVEVLLLWPGAELSGDAAENLSRLGGEGIAEYPDGGIAAPLEGSGAVVDAIFGTGFSGAPRAPAEAAIEAINACDAEVVAADIPSGVDASTGAGEGAAVNADATVTFHAVKLGHWVAPGRVLRGELEVAAIGIPPGQPGEPAAGLITPAVLELPPRRGLSSTKFTSGEVLVIGGSRGLTGAVVLASSAAIRAGAGYATVAVPADLEAIFEVKLTEVMSRGFDGAEGRLASADAGAILAAADRATAVVVGPGMGRDADTFELVRELVAKLAAPLVLDADGLNAVAGSLELLAGRQAAAVITPHEGELARLLETESAEVSARRLEHAREAARRSGAVVVLKGNDTIVCDGDGEGERLAVNPVAAPALATAGTGDVLSGTIAALLARGTEPFAATCAAVHAHARAGNLAARDRDPESVIATDVVAALPAGLGSASGDE